MPAIHLRRLMLCLALALPPVGALMVPSRAEAASTQGRRPKKKRERKHHHHRSHKERHAKEKAKDKRPAARANGEL